LALVHSFPLFEKVARDGDQYTFAGQQQRGDDAWNIADSLPGPCGGAALNGE